MFKPFAGSTRSSVITLVATMAFASVATPTLTERLGTPFDVALGRPHGPAGAGATTARDAFARLPGAFVENRGQIDPQVRFYAQGPRHAFYLTRDRVVLSFLDAAKERGVTLDLRFPGGHPLAGPEGAARASGEINYLRGNDPAAWRTGIPRYAEAVYQGVWPGIDLRLNDQGGTLKYEFRLRPGARVADARLEYKGASALAIEPSGALRIETAIGILHDSAPVSYQVVGGERVPVASRYVLRDTGGTLPEVGFAVDGARPDRELVIDPGIQYSALLGGSSDDLAAGVRVDASGNAYVVGTTQSPDFRTTAGAFKRTGAAGNFGDVFVTKLNAAGSALVYSTFIGGNDFDWGRAIAIDAAGNAYITGQTKSSSFPTTGGAFDRTFNVDTCPRCGIDQYDAFVTKLNAAGSALVYSTFLGGFDIDDGLGIAVDAAGNAYVTGETGSLNFPVRAGSFDTTRNADYDAFVTKLNPTGSALVYSTYLGGAAVEFGSRIAVSASGQATIVGSTRSSDFPTTPGAFDNTANGEFDAFVTRLNAAGSALVYSTFLGGSGFDSGSGVFVDSSGSAYVAGGAGSVDFPTTPGAFDTTPDGSDGFLVRLTPAGSALMFSTVIGGSEGDGANAVALDAAGSAWLTGSTGSADFPVTGDAADSSFNGGADAFITGLSADGSTLLYSTYLGGRNSETGSDLAVDPSGDVYVVGHTYSIDFPTTAGAVDVVFNGDLTIFWGDAFVTKLDVDANASAPPSTPPAPLAPTLLAPFNNDVPLQPITFDWGEVGGAAAYTIQIDDSSAFTAPLVREQTVATSMSVSSGLATIPHFWRVRAINTAGVPGPWSAVRTFTPEPAPPPPGLSTFSTNPSTVAGGNSSSGTVVLSTSAPEGGAVIALSSSHPAIAGVPATATAQAFAFTADFLIATSPVTATTTVTITASYNGTTRTASLVVTPGGPGPSATLQSVTVAPSSVTGGAPSSGTIVLSAAAPAGGAVVALSSSDAAVAVPSTVTVAPGALTAGFGVTTTAVGTPTSAVVSASYNGVTRLAGITVTSAEPPPPPPPPQTAALTVSASGRGGERVTSSPAGISVATGASGTATFATGTSITLSVTNGRDAIWSGACSSAGSKRKTCTFTLNTNSSVSANVQ